MTGCRPAGPGALLCSRVSDSGAFVDNGGHGRPLPRFLEIQLADSNRRPPGAIQAVSPRANLAVDVRASLRDGYGTKGTRRFLVPASTSLSPEAAIRRITVLGNDVFYFIPTTAEGVVHVDLDINFIAEM